MQKNKHRSEASFDYDNRRATARRHGIEFPEIVNIDVIGTMLDEDLVVRLRTLEEDREKAYEAGYRGYSDLRPWEDEISYIRREQQLRRERRDAHAEYLKRLDDEHARAEASLPAGDFDNYNFVYAATGGRPRWG